VIAAPTAITLDPLRRRFLWSSLYVGVTLALVVCGAVASHAVTLGSVAGNWFYRYGQPATLELAALWLLYSAAGTSLVLLGLYLARRVNAWLVVLAWIVLATGMQWGLRHIAAYPLEALFVSDSANSFYSVTLRHDAADILRSFNRLRSNAPLHVQSNMPGKLLVIEALQHISPRTDVLPWLVIALSNLGALLMFGFVRSLFEEDGNGDGVALNAAALYLFLPARSFFFPLMNTVTPLLALACAWLLVRWLSTGKSAYAALMGAALYALVFFEPLPLVLGLLFLALVLRSMLVGTVRWDRFVVQAALAIFAFIATAEAVSLTTGFDLVRAFHAIRGHASEFNQSDGRPYGLWIVANLWEFGFGMGLCQAAILLGTLGQAARRPGTWLNRLAKPDLAMAAGVSAVLIAVDLIGMNRGEVTRLWIFLACFFQIPTAYVCATLPGRSAIALVIAVTTLHTAIAVSMINFVVP
jgi:hypothetical protein